MKGGKLSKPGSVWVFHFHIQYMSILRRGTKLCHPASSVLVQVARVYSKTWSHREDALLAMHKKLLELSPSSPRDELRNTIRAAVCLVKKALLDKVSSVSCFSIRAVGVVSSGCLLVSYVSYLKSCSPDSYHKLKPMSMVLMVSSHFLNNVAPVPYTAWVLAPPAGVLKLTALTRIAL